MRTNLQDAISSKHFKELQDHVKSLETELVWVRVNLQDAYKKKKVLEG